MKTHLAYLFALSFCILTIKSQAQWINTEVEQNAPLELAPKIRHIPGSKVHTEQPTLSRKSIHALSRLVPSKDPETPVTNLLSSWEKRQLNRQASCSFFGTRFPLYYDSRAYFRTSSRQYESHFVQYWRQLENSRYELLLKQISRQAKNLQLNDWGLGLLLHETATEIYANDRNAQVLFELFALNKLGYAARVCQSGNRLHLMLPANQVIYGATYLREGSRKYYILDFGGGLPEVRRARVLNLNYGTNGKALNFEMQNAPNLTNRSLVRRLAFDYKSKRYEYEVRLNRNLIEYYNNYPFTDLNIRFGTPLSTEAHYTLLTQLRASMRGMSETEAVDFLLGFVQKAFGYQTDREQFGKEKYLFAEQTLYYLNSDCEDRSVLFAYLVKEILGLNTIGLLFPGHVATAVQFRGAAEGSYIRYKGAKYYVCDPTYINATYGMTIPEVRNKDVRIIRF